jgi:multiple RNA-binding domain-containing protein 1
MQPPSRSKTWANGDAIGGVGHDVPNDPIAEGERSANYEPVLKNPKEPVRDIVGDSLASKRMKGAIHKPLNELSTSSGHKNIADNAHVTETDREFAEQSGTPVSDAEWLRSRTSRLLGLQDSVEDPGPTEIYSASADTNSHLEMGESRPGHLEDTVKFNEGLDEGNVEERGVDDRDATVEVINASRRLFVRNLSYGATEDDLRNQFSQFGSLEEVRNCGSFSSNIAYVTLAFIVMNILIGTAYAVASDVNRKKYFSRCFLFLNRRLPSRFLISLKLIS